MAKPEWGVKRTCQNCGARFYDLRRDPIVCPVCTTVYDVERQPRVRRGGGVVKEETTSRPKVSKVVAADELADSQLDEPADIEDVEGEDESEASGDGDDLADLESEGQDLIEDTSDLGEDGDDIGEVMEHIDEDVEDKS